MTYSQDAGLWLTQAKDLMSAKQYEKAALKWDSLRTFRIGIDVKVQYLRLQCWALTHQSDKAFDWLFSTVKDTYYLDYEEVNVDSTLTFLHTDKRWVKFSKILKKRSQNFDRPLIKRLVAFVDLDQAARHRADSIGQTVGWDSDAYNAAQREMYILDSVTITTMTRIIDSAGWLGRDRLGETGGLALFLAIQHTESLETKKKYLLHLKEAHRKKWEIRVPDIAYLEDRIAILEGKPQRYGTQFMTVDGKNKFFPIEDLKNVNKRRKKLELSPIEQYAKFARVSF
jgi:hypothetical protein